MKLASLSLRSLALVGIAGLACAPEPSVAAHPTAAFPVPWSAESKVAPAPGAPAPPPAPPPPGAVPSLPPAMAAAPSAAPPPPPKPAPASGSVPMFEP